MCESLRPGWRERVLSQPLQIQSRGGYTAGMKTAISIPDDIYATADRLAKRLRKSRSELFSDAVAEYIARHSPDEVTEAMDKVCEDAGTGDVRFVTSAARRILERSEW